MGKKTIKNIRINSEVHREIADIIRADIKDPRIKPMTIVTGAEVTNDLKYCKVYISVLGNEDEARETIEGLKSAAGFIRSLLASKLNLRNTPELRFVPDNSLEYGMKISRLIDEVVNKDMEVSDNTDTSTNAADINILEDETEIGSDEDKTEE